MITERIIVSDTNILLDLLSVGMLDAFFSLPCEVFTTDFIVLEISRPDQNSEVQKYIKSKKLTVVSFEFEELIEINGIYEANTNNASISDCSVWYYAKKTGGRLLTGDGKLRKSAEKDCVKVSGILYVFDNLIEYGLMEKRTAADVLEKLMSLNMRLPRTECETRIAKWRKN